MKIGIFGGTFNPPHYGHLITSEIVREQLQLDKILFIPTAIPPHKTDRFLLDGKLRLNMLQLAVMENSYFEVSDIELARGGKSYTIDTLKVLAKLYPKSSLYLIIGIDNLIDFHTWKSPNKILEKSEVVVINRPGFETKTVRNKFTKRVTFIRVPNIDISSREIRRRVKQGKSIKYLVPPAVEQYILTKGIYRD